MRYPITSLLVGAAIPLLATGAFAQTASGVVADQQDSVADNSDDIIVTATRTSTVLSRTPLAITALTGDTLTKAGVTDPTLLADLTPNLSVDRTGFAGVQITIRGVSSTDSSEKGDSSAGFVLDGIFIARPQAQDVSFFDLDRVEVLRGPQGTLYGRNTTAGLISLISAAPRLGEWSGSIDATYGAYNSVQSTGMLNVPVGQHVAIRAAVNYDRRDSYLKQGSSPYSLDPARNNLSGRLSLLAQPTDRLKIVLRGDYSNIEGRTTLGVRLSNLYQSPFQVPASGQLGVDPVVRTLSNDAASTLGYAEAWPSSRHNNTWGIGGDVTYAMADGLTLNYLGSHRELTRDEQLTGLTGVLRATGAVVTSRQTFGGQYKQDSHELRLAYDGNGLKLQTGAYYFKEKSDISYLLFGTQGYLPGQRGYVFGFPFKTNSKSFALFGQGTVDITSDFRVTGGVRGTRDEKSRVGAIIYHATVDDPVDFTTGVQPGTTNPRGVRDSLSDASVKYSKITWRAGVEYDVSSTSLLYATIATGYKAGGFNDGCLAGTENCSTSAARPASLLFYQPETLTSYEAGFKSRVLGNALRINGSVFHYDYSNLQLTQLTIVAGGTTSQTLNAGQAKIDGVELETVLKPHRNHQADFSVTWLNARYTDYLLDPASSATQFAGKSLDRSPEWSINAAYTWTIPLGDAGSNFALNAHTRLSDSYVITSSALRAQLRQPSFTKTDLNVTFTAPRGAWYLQGFVRNVENRLTLAAASIVANFGAGFDDGFAQLSDPRTYGVRAGVRF